MRLGKLSFFENKKSNHLVTLVCQSKLLSPLFQILFVFCINGEEAEKRLPEIVFAAGLTFSACFNSTFYQTLSLKSMELFSGRRLRLVSAQVVFNTCMTAFHTCFTIGPIRLFISFYPRVPLVRPHYLIAAITNIT